MTSDPHPENLIVEFVIPHYFASLFATHYPDEHGGFGAQVFFRDTHDHPISVIGDVAFIENADGQWLIDVEYEGDVYPASLRTFVENVERIVVM